ncbi:MAG TPA: CHASE domain-containing protein, partial [Bacteroidales bacterium]|nr:CHASE domain-containing protein [Bacteroidales bacterium]
LHKDDAKRVEKEFFLKCNDIQIRILTRLEAHEQLLNAASAYFEASDTVTREEWKSFVENSNILKELPGIQGIGFCAIVDKKKIPELKERLERDGLSDFSVYPGGERDIYTSIIFLEPFDWRNKRALGFDMFSEPVRRKSMELARDSGFAVISGKVKLLQETDDDVQAGTLMLVPVYQKGNKTSPELRKSAIAGWVYSPYRMDDLIRGILGRSFDDQISFRIYADSIAPENLLCDNRKPFPGSRASKISTILPVNFHGSSWIIEAHGDSSFFSSWTKAITVFSIGLAITLLLFHLYIALLRTRSNAQARTGELTRDLVESEEKYRLMAENISDLIWIMNLKSMRFSYVSPSVFRLTGYTTEEAMNLDLESWLGADTAPEVKKMIEERISEYIENPGVRKYYYNELLQTSKNGDKIWIEVMSHFQYSKNGDLEIFGVSRNIDERKKDEQQLKQSEQNLKHLNATKDRLFSIIAHDLRSPFSSILGFSRIIAECCRNNQTEKAIRMATMLNSAAGHTLMLLENLLEWARNQTGEIEFRPGTCILYPVVLRITDVLKTTAEIKKITVVNSIDPEVHVFADMNMLEFILRNLASNAVKFTNPGGKIIVSSVIENGKVNVSVEDNGIGITGELRRKLLDSDEHVSSIGTANEKGSGLGLLLCKDFLRKHDSTLSIESSPGKGSRFTFTLREMNVCLR